MNYETKNGDKSFLFISFFDKVLNQTILQN